MRHLLIAGTGRSGTSLLVRILDAAGLDTELGRAGENGWHDDANAGLETIPLLDGDHPYVVKSPWSYQFIDELLERKDIEIDSVIIPIRRIEEAACSRVITELSKRHISGVTSNLRDLWSEGGSTVPGGITYSMEPLDQARVLAVSLHKLIELLERKEVRYRFLSFPRFALDLSYCYRRLSDLLPKDVSHDEFVLKTSQIVDAAKVRTGDELRQMLDAQLSDSAVPSLTSLNAIAAKRAIQSLTHELNTVKALHAKSFPKWLIPQPARAMFRRARLAMKSP